MSRSDVSVPQAGLPAQIREQPAAAPVVVGVTGASGACLALKTLEILRDLGVKTHLVFSGGAHASVTHELGTHGIAMLSELAEHTYDAQDMLAPIASGSFQTSGMIVTPCSMRSLSAIAYSLTDNLLTRAADVALKERRKLVIAPREAPLHEGHIEAMLKVTRMGGIVCPPVPPFYAGLASLDQLITEVAARGINSLGIDPKHTLTRWQGGAL